MQFNNFHLPTRIVALYLCREYLRLFFLCLLFLLALSLLVDFFDRFSSLVKNDPAFSTVLRYFLFKLPLFVTQAVPAAALAGCLLSLGLLTRNKELMALKSCGVSVFQMATPLLLTALFLSFSAWIWNEKVVPFSFQKSRYINTVEIKQRAFKGLFHEQGFWYHGEQSFYHVTHFDPRRNTLAGITVYRLDKNYQISSLIEVRKAVWEDQRWVLEGVRETTFGLDGTQPQYIMEELLQETPGDFSLVAMKAEEFSSQSLARRIDDLRQKGLDTTEYQVDLRLKAALPFATFVMTLLGVALGLPGAKQLALPTALTAAFLIGFGYWVFLALTVSLGHAGVLSPLPAAWLGNITAALLATYFLLGME